MKTIGIITICTAILIFIMGFIAFNVATDAISGPYASPAMNTTSNVGSTVFSMIGIVLVIGVLLTLIGIVYFWVSTPERYKKPSKLIAFLGKTTYYFGFGLLFVAIFAVPGYLMYFLYTYTVVDGNTGFFVDAVKWISIAVVLYFGISGAGYFFKKKIIDNWTKRREEVKLEKLKEEKKEKVTT